LLIAGVAIGAMLLVSIAIIAAVAMQFQPQPDNAFVPPKETARPTVPKPVNKNTNPKVSRPAPPAAEKTPKVSPSATPVPPPNPAMAVAGPSQKFASARRNMAQRDLDAAERDLAAGRSAAFVPSEREECDRLEMILALLRAYWTAVRSGWNTLEPGEELPINNATYTVVKVEPTSLLLRSAGKETAFTLESLTGDLAETLASRHLDANSPSIFLCIGAFHAMDRFGDKQQASALWDQAANAGMNLAPLMPELKRQ
jgi:hypothetical protein